MADSRTSNVIKNSGASLLNKLVHMLVQFGMRTVFIYFLGNEYTGVSSLFTDILQVLSLMELGLDTSMIYSLYGPLARQDHQRISALMNFYRKAFTVIGFAVLGAGLLCVPFLQYIVKGVPNIKEDIRGIFLMYVATSAFSYFLVYKTVLLRANQKSRIISNWTTIIYVTESIAEVILLLIFRAFYAYLIVHLLATVLRNIILSRKTDKLYPDYVGKTEERLPREDRKALFRDLACLTVYSTAGVVIHSTDSIFISSFVGTVQVTIIGNHTLIINSIRHIVSQIVNTTKPSIGNLAAKSDTEKQETVFYRMFFISFWVSCFTCTGLFVLLNPFVGDIWFNPSYKVSMVIIAVMVANYFIPVMGFPVESFRTANGLFVQGWMRPAIMAALNLVLDYFLGRAWGIFGIFIATTISRLATQTWYDPWLVHKKVFRKSPAQFFAKYGLYAAITAVSCFAVYELGNLISVSNRWIGFGTKLILVCLIPNLLVIALFRKTAEFEYTRNLMKKITGKIRKKVGKV